MKKYFLLLSLFLCFSAYSQNSINNYKYVIVPEKFPFLKEIDEYSLNNLTKSLLQNKGFTVYFNNPDLPKEIANNKCLALTAEVLEKGNMFSTGLTLLLKDCQGNIVFKGKQGTSREKDYELSYTMALKDAFTSLDNAKYAYVGPASEPVQSVVTATVPRAAVTQTVAATKAPVTSKEAVSSQPTATLYAQATANGYQLIDTSPKIVLTLMKTSTENYFIATSATANGVVKKKNDDWYFEYYKGDKLISEKLLIKF